MAAGYGVAGAGVPHVGHAPPQRRPPVKRPKKAVCKHCHQEVTPAAGSPMHAEQQAPPQINSAMAAMAQGGGQDFAPGGMPGGGLPGA